MPSTFKNPSTTLRLRAEASGPEPTAGTKSPSKNLAKNPDGSVPRAIWTRFQSVLLRALTPFTEPRERVIQAILELETELGFAL